MNNELLTNRTSSVPWIQAKLCKEVEGQKTQGSGTEGKTTKKKKHNTTKQRILQH